MSENIKIKKRAETVEDRREKRRLISKNIMTSKETAEFMGITRQRLNRIVQDGRLPFIQNDCFMTDDIIAYQKAFDEARRNKTWLREFE